jgi:hypothetical protein
LKPLESGLANAMVVDKNRNERGWRAVFLWLDRERLEPEWSSAPKGEFSVAIRPLDFPLKGQRGQAKLKMSLDDTK